MDKNMCSDEEYIRALREGKPAKMMRPKDAIKRATRLLDKAFSPRCEHTMQPMFAAHNDSFRGMRCSKCGYSEYA